MTAGCVEISTSPAVIDRRYSSIRGFALNLLRMEDQFLHAPIHDLGDIKFVFRRTGDFVNPAELLWLFAGAAQNAENLSIESQLIKPARKRVGGVQHLIGAGRDAYGPGCAGVLAAGGFGRWHGSHPRFGIRR